MSATELQFRTAAFGGFQKQDVLSYIESANQTHTEKLEGLQRERDELTREKEELEARANQAQEQVQALTQEKEELTAQLDSVRSEMEELRRALEVERASLSQTADQLSQANARLSQTEPDAVAYQQVKDRTAGIELEAHCRAQEVQQAAGPHRGGPVAPQGTGRLRPAAHRHGERRLPHHPGPGQAAAADRGAVLPLQRPGRPSAQTVPGLYLRFRTPRPRTAAPG